MRCSYVRRLQSACRQRTDRAEVENETKEADIVSVRIAIPEQPAFGYELRTEKQIYAC